MLHGEDAQMVRLQAVENGERETPQQIPPHVPFHGAPAVGSLLDCPANNLGLLVRGYAHAGWTPGAAMDLIGKS